MGMEKLNEIYLHKGMFRVNINLKFKLTFVVNYALTMV